MGVQGLALLALLSASAGTEQRQEGKALDAHHRGSSGTIHGLKHMLVKRRAAMPVGAVPTVWRYYTASTSL